MLVQLCFSHFYHCFHLSYITFVLAAAAVVAAAAAIVAVSALTVCILMYFPIQIDTIRAVPYFLRGHKSKFSKF